MNLVDCYVTEIIGIPYFEYGFWWQKVKFNSYGVIGETKFFDKEKTSFETIKIGFKFYN